MVTEPEGLRQLLVEFTTAAVKQQASVGVLSKGGGTARPLCAPCRLGVTTAAGCLPAYCRCCPPAYRCSLLLPCRSLHLLQPADLVEFGLSYFTGLKQQRLEQAALEQAPLLRVIISGAPASGKGTQASCQQLSVCPCRQSAAAAGPLQHPLPLSQATRPCCSLGFSHCPIRRQPALLRSWAWCTSLWGICCALRWQLVASWACR